MPNEVKVPKFAYPFKRRSNTATKTKSDQELYEEILFKDYQGQYLFNRSGLFHGGVHLYEDRFPINDFDTDGIRAIADGKIIYYRIDEEFLENELDDGTILKYSSSFMLLEHEIEYPATNILKFYSLYMHMAPASEYEFIEHVLDGEPVYVRDIDGADMSIARGTKVTLGKSFKDKDVGTGLTDKKNRYEVLSYGNNIKPPANEGWNVHITNLKKVVVTTVKGSSTNKPNIRKGSKNDSPFVKLLSAGDSIEVNAFQTEQEKASKRYAVISVNGTAVPVTYPCTTISKGNLTDTITEPKINNLENGCVTKHMSSLTGGVFPTSGIEVKAGDVLGKLGCYNTKEWEDEMELVTHLEVFTFDDLEKFIEDATTEYETTRTLTDEEKKVRPKENQLFVKADVKRYIKEDGVYAKIAPPDGTCTLKAGNESKIIANGAIVKISPTVVNRRHTVLSIEEGDDAMKRKLEEDTSKTWTVHSASVKVKHSKFTEIAETRTDFYVKDVKSLNNLKELKDKDNETYILLEKRQGIDVYVKKNDIKNTHGITFKAFTYMEGEGEKKIGIFEDVSKFYSKREDKVPQQEKEKLNELYAKILKHIKLDKDESEARKNMLEAGEFAALSKQNVERRRAMSHILIKHESEWKNEKEKFTPVLDYMKNHNQNDRKKMFEDRLKNLAFFPDVHIGEGKTPTFIHPIALVEGFVGGGGCLSMEKLTRIFPGATLEKKNEVLNIFNKYCEKFELNTPLRIAHFFAQVKQEVGKSLVGKSEDLWYRIGALKSLFSRYFGIYPNEADELGYIRIEVDQYRRLSSQDKAMYTYRPEDERYYKQFPKPDEIAKRVYCCNNSRGDFNLQQGGCEDGLRYKGKGFIQLTWKGNYRKVNEILNNKVTDMDIDIETNPDSVLETEIGILSAMGFWEWKKLNNIADTGATGEIVDKITAIVNLKTRSYAERRTHFTNIYNILRNS